jgi:hypothetical protein
VWQIGGHYQGGISLAPASVPDPSTINFIAQTDDLSNATVYTFTNASIGDAYESRIVVVSVHTDGANIGVNDVSIAGTTGTVIEGSSAQPNAALAYRVVPTTTAADIVVTWSGASQRCSIGVWSITGTASATPIETTGSIQAASSRMSVTLDLPTGSFGVVAQTNGAAGLNPVWNLGTEEYNSSPEAAMTISAVTLTGQGSTGVLIESSGVTGGKTVGASWL